MNRLFRSSDRSMSGQRTRHSTTMNPARIANATMPATRVSGEYHPQVGARSKVSVNKPIPMVIKDRPSRSTRRGTVSSRLSGMVRTPIDNDATAKGTSNQNTARQPTDWVSSPPTNGPAAFPKPAMA